MIDFALIQGFEWDEGNSAKSVSKHGVSQSEAEQVFLNQPLALMIDAKHNLEESRLQALGRTDAGRRLHITFTLRHAGTRIRVISARDMSRRERNAYEQG